MKLKKERLKDEYKEKGAELIDTVLSENRNKLTKQIIKSEEFQEIAFVSLLEYEASDLLDPFLDFLWNADDITATRILNQKKLKWLIEFFLELLNSGE
jgi:hypothetical protein